MDIKWLKTKFLLESNCEKINKPVHVLKTIGHFDRKDTESKYLHKYTPVNGTSMKNYNCA